MSQPPLLTRLTHWIPPLLGIVLFSISIWAIHQQLQQHSPQELLASLSAIAERSLLLAVGLTFLNYVTLTGYDTLAVYYTRHPLSYPKTAIASVISYAISNSVGFALLSSSAIRYRFYSPWGFSTLEIAQIIAFCNLSFWLGLFTVGGMVFLVEPIAIPKLLHLPFQSAQPIGVIFLTVVGAYLLWNALSHRALRLGTWVLPHFPIQLCLAQIVITSLDWILAAAVLYVMLPEHVPLSFISFLSIYLLSQIAGIISNVPGGLGVFETVMLLSLSPPLSSATLFGALLAYRCVYYFLPLGISTLLLALYEIRHRLGGKRSSK